MTTMVIQVAAVTGVSPAGGGQGLFGNLVKWKNREGGATGETPGDAGGAPAGLPLQREIRTWKAESPGTERFWRSAASTTEVA